MTVFNPFMQNLLEDPLGLVLSVLDDTLGEPAILMKVRYLSQAEASKFTYRPISFSALSTESEP